MDPSVNREIEKVNYGVQKGNHNLQFYFILSICFRFYVVSILQLEDDPQLKHSYLRKNAFKQYFELVNSMFLYENELFDRYLYKATYMANVEVRKNILAMAIFRKSKGLF